eukprot:CAMPEP_0206063710 /NCGR_PEP_ID=MMETSP1466-20131121/58367_1 /ASSEMBLY_ACC=CAM_ASM_001126 /TAXON_ID=44452 /ORGANISM="Pavlova gyrans, Strain CCMP608" /LENGTH=34 /DNA_ID= /DNA_START= /DNA_END= /DNA_ORIENTATION=
MKAGSLSVSYSPPPLNIVGEHHERLALLVGARDP